MIIDFPGKNSDENIIMVIRKHPIVYIRLLMVFLALSLLPATIFMIFWSGRFPISTGDVVGISGYLIACFYLLYSLVLFLIAWLNEEFDLFILTDQRLIDITQIHFFKRKENVTPLRNIEDVTTDIHGILPTLLNYGTLDIQTASGNADDFIMDHVANPVLISKQILNVVRENQKKSMLEFGPMGSSKIEEKKNDL